MATALAPYASHPELPQFHDQVANASRSSPRSARRLGTVTSASPLTRGSTPSSTPTRDAVRARRRPSSRCRRACWTPWASVTRRWSSCTSAAQRAARARRSIASSAASTCSQRPGARPPAIENDDRVVRARRCARPRGAPGCAVVWDVLHHHCLDPAAIPDDEAMAAAFATWPAGTTPKVHFSSPRLDVEERTREGGRSPGAAVLPQLRSHADMIDPIAFEIFLRGPRGRVCASTSCSRRRPRTSP